MFLINKVRSGPITIEKLEPSNEFYTVESTGNDVPVLVVDVETTGLSYDNDKVIQIAIRPVMFDGETGKLTRVLNPRVFYNDPGFDVPPEITKLTGVRNEDVKGKSVDWNWVAKIMSKVKFVIAHNVGFDRHFIKKHMIESDVAMPETIWACSMSQVDWRGLGCSAGRSLETLSAWHGFYYDAHDAGADVSALINLLSVSNELNNTVTTLFETAMKSQWRVFAVNFPRNKNDELKARKYRWDPDVMMWWKGFTEHEDAEVEMKWLSNDHQIEPQLFEIKACHLFD